MTAPATAAASASETQPSRPIPSDDAKSPNGLEEVARRVEGALGSVLIRKPEQVRLVTAAVLTGSHMLLHDLPGVGKTTLASATARVIGGEFRRVQGGPDLLPTDLTGAVILDQATGEWRYRPGPLLSNVVLVDEINRISPRTQSALLQVMAERKISIEGAVRKLPDPYFVIATMNPRGSTGTFAMASGQLDRFDIAVELGPVDRAGERELLRRDAAIDLVDQIQPVLPANAWAEVRRAVAAVHVADSILDYVLDLCSVVRQQGHISVRGSRSLVELGQGMAVLDGRQFVIPDDIKAAAAPTLAHRLIGPNSTFEEVTQRVRIALEQVAVPVSGG